MRVSFLGRSLRIAPVLLVALLGAVVSLSAACEQVDDTASSDEQELCNQGYGYGYGADRCKGIGYGGYGYR